MVQGQYFYVCHADPAWLSGSQLGAQGLSMGGREARFMPVWHREHSAMILEFSGCAFLRFRQYSESQHLNQLR
jgi:hypothetical protein